MKRVSRKMMIVGSVALLGCSAGGGNQATVGHVGDGGGSKAGSGGAGSIALSDGGTSKTLSAHIERPSGVTVTVVTVGCADACADVRVVAHGGFPPYTFKWDDGSTNPARTICPSATTQFVASATDTGSPSGEFARPPANASARVTADVIQCPEGGVTRLDASTPPNGPCITNPSIEGTPQAGAAFAWDAKGWQQCPWLGLYPTYLANQLVLDPATAYPRPSDGNTYAVIQDNLLVLAGFGQELCSPPTPGAAQFFTVDLAYVPEPADAGTASAPRIQILGGDVPCTGTDVLWTSPPLTEAWSTYCVALDPAKPTRSITFNPFDKLSAFILVDHLVSVDGCP
jgi:hypothetical protein